MIRLASQNELKDTLPLLNIAPRLVHVCHRPPALLTCVTLIVYIAPSCTCLYLLPALVTICMQTLLYYMHCCIISASCCYDIAIFEMHVTDMPKIALHMQRTDLHLKEPNPKLPHLIPLIPGILHHVQKSSKEL